LKKTKRRAHFKRAQGLGSGFPLPHAAHSLRYRVFQLENPPSKPQDRRTTRETELKLMVQCLDAFVTSLLFRFFCVLLARVWPFFSIAFFLAVVNCVIFSIFSCRGRGRLSETRPHLGMLLVFDVSSWSWPVFFVGSSLHSSGCLGRPLSFRPFRRQVVPSSSSRWRRRPEKRKGGPPEFCSLHLFKKRNGAAGRKKKRGSGGLPPVFCKLGR